VLPFSNLSSEEISEMYSLSDSTTPCEVNEDGVNEQVLPFSALDSEEISEMYNSSYSITVSELNEEESSSSSLSSEEISESIILPFSSYTDNNSSSTSEKHSLFSSNNPSSSGKNTIDTFEEIYYKKREVKGAFFTEKKFEDYVTPFFKSCRSIKEVNRVTDHFILELKNITSRFQGENRDDISETTRIYDNSVFDTNKTIRLNNENITDLRSKLQDTRDTDKRADLSNQLAALTNQNTHLSDYLTTVIDARSNVMDTLNSSFEEEGEITGRRSSLLYSLSDTHTARILDLYRGFDWYASEPEYSETEALEKEDSNTAKDKHKETENNHEKGKSKAEDVPENNALFSVTNNDSIDLQYDNDIQTAIRESINDIKDTYKGESSKMGGSSRK
jgi:hypothetical protein